MVSRVSVVILDNGNVASFKKFLSDLLEQTYRNLEVVCVTNKEETLDLLKDYQSRSEVVVLDCTSREIGSFYNLAIQKATGKFIIFLDSKCHLEKNAIEKMVTMADQKDAQIVISEFYNIGNKPFKKISHIPSCLLGKKMAFSLYNQKDLYLLILPGLFNKLIQVELIRENNITLDGKNGYFDYISFLFLCLMCANKVYLLNDYLFYCYYSILNQNKKFRLQLVQELDVLYQQLKKRKMNKVLGLYSGTVVSFLKNVFKTISSENIRDELHLIKENFSPVTFNYLFCSDRGYLACKSVSIIIPVYNAGKYLKRCLDSACHQTLEDIEIICVDDGSTDESLDILKEYEEKDKRITVVYQENQGQSIARNYGMRIAAGEFYQFLDADDYLEPDSCETLFLYSKIFNLQMCFLMALVHHNNEIQKQWKTINYFLKASAEKLPAVFNKTHLGNKIMNLSHAPWATFYSRKFLIDYHIHFINKRLTYCEDLPFFIVSLLKANRMGAVLTPLYHYCFTSEGSTTQYRHSSTQLKDLCFVFLYTLNMLYRLGGAESFNLYADSFSNSILKDINQKDGESKKKMEKYVFQFYFTLVRKYSYNLPKNCYDWCLQYLKGKPFGELKFKFFVFYNNVKTNYLSKIITYQDIPSLKIIKFLGLPIGYQKIQMLKGERIRKIVLFRITILKIREEL